MHEFAGVVDHICSNEHMWKVWYDHNAPESQFLPAGCGNSFGVAANRFA
jgi:hypothetical protein